MGHKGPVYCVVYSPDGEALASSSFDNTIQIWDAPPAPTGASVRIEGKREHGASPFEALIVFSKSMRGFERSDIHVENGAVTAFSGSGDSYTATIQPSGIHTVRVRVPKKAAGNHGRSNTFAFYPALRTTLTEPYYNSSAVFSPDSSKLAIADPRTRIQIRNLSTGETIRNFGGQSFATGGNHILYSPDGSMLAAGNRDILIWEADTFKKLHILKEPKGETVKAISISPDSTMLANSSGSDVRIWNLKTGKEIRTLTGFKDDVFSVAFSPDGKTLASASRNDVIQFWNADTGEEIRTLAMQFGRAEAVAFSPDGSMFAGGGRRRCRSHMERRHRRGAADAHWTYGGHHMRRLFAGRINARQRQQRRYRPHLEPGNRRDAPNA